MTGRFANGLQTAANLATIVAASLLSIILVRIYLLPAPVLRPVVQAPTLAGVAIGSNLKAQLPDIAWSANGETVLLALSTRCHFCTESAPFFQQLSKRSGKDFKIVAVLPESVAASQEYLKRQGVRVDQVRQMSLDKLGIAGTPTMLLVDKSGRVKQTWVGKLSEGEQEIAFKSVLHS